jgi:hypothetical protein
VSAARRAAVAGLLCAALLPAPRARAAEPELLVDFSDPVGDGHGPGSYQLPTDGSFTEGDFDLRRFTVQVDGDEVIFSVTLGANIRKPEVTQRDNSSSLDLTAGLYLQNIDIYIDQSRAPGSGYSACIPGRRVAFAGGRTWETAIVLTPQPGPTRAALEAVLGPQVASHVVVPDVVDARARTVSVRVPVLALGSRPTRSWGYSVQLSGARWERTFQVVDRIRGSLDANAFTMEVAPVPDTWIFGGGPEGSQHPRLLDVILPPGVEQRQVLTSFGEAPGDWAKVPFVDLATTGTGPAMVLAPMQSPPPRDAGRDASRSGGDKSDADRSGADKSVTPSGPGGQPGLRGPQPGSAGAPARPLVLTPTSPLPPPPAKVKPGPELTVAFVAGELVSLSGLAYTLKPMMFGRVVDKDGTLVARVVVVNVIEGGAVASAVDNREKIKPGMKVRFEGN